MIEELIEARQKARAAKDWALADELRAAVESTGLKLHDNPDGSLSIIRPEEAAKAPPAEPSPKAAPVSSWRHQQHLKVRLRTKAMKPRCIHFAAWIVETFGASLLRGDWDGIGDGRGRTVMDVAGGHGDLAWALCTTHGIPTTVVDPMPLRLSVGKTKWLIQRTQRMAPAEAATIPAVDDSLAGTASVVAPPPPFNSPTGHAQGSWEASARALALAVGDYRAAWLDGPTLDAATLGDDGDGRIYNSDDGGGSVCGSVRVARGKPAGPALARLRARHGFIAVETKGATETATRIELGAEEVGREGKDEAEESACVLKLRAVLRLLGENVQQRETKGGGDHDMIADQQIEQTDYAARGLGLVQHRGLFGWAEVEGRGNGIITEMGASLPPLAGAWARATAVVGMHTDQVNVHQPRD
jgi:hypothetical protein